ncbi:MAG: hypothetical protein D6820_14500 [Lentisphaerae bacterium]|nr:MAG: hypothetical protein D6820_14500 [Lentisphaerota bacterium]
MRLFPTAKSKRWLRHAFTAAELSLVTALLSSIPISSYTKVRQKAYQTQCVSHLRNIAMALSMFRDENGHFPKAKFFTRNPNDPRSIRNQLAPYGAGNKSMWICPALPSAFQKYGCTFLYNDELGGKNNAPNPSQTWVLIEITCVNGKLPYPHPDGFNILYADGSVRTTRKLPADILRNRKAQIKQIVDEMVAAGF